MQIVRSTIYTILLQALLLIKPAILYAQSTPTALSTYLTKDTSRINQLNKKKVEYLLTPKGFSEKMRKSVRYTIKTICSIGLIKKRWMVEEKEWIRDLKSF